jgi:hypothetical protein
MSSKRRPAEQYTCSSCGRKFQSPFDIAPCPYCGTLHPCKRIRDLHEADRQLLAKWGIKQQGPKEENHASN